MLFIDLPCFIFSFSAMIVFAENNLCERRIHE